MAVSGSVLGIGVRKQAINTEVAAFDPNALGVLKTWKDDAAAISGADDNVGILRSGTWAGIRVELTVEEFVECFEGVGWAQNFRHVKLVEADESRDLGGRGRVVVFPALFEGHAAEEFAD